MYWTLCRENIGGAFRHNLVVKAGRVVALVLNNLDDPLSSKTFSAVCAEIARHNLRHLYRPLKGVHVWFLVSKTKDLPYTRMLAPLLGDCVQAVGNNIKYKADTVWPADRVRVFAAEDVCGHITTDAEWETFLARINAIACSNHTLQASGQETLLQWLVGKIDEHGKPIADQYAPDCLTELLQKRDSVTDMLQHCELASAEEKENNKRKALWGNPSATATKRCKTTHANKPATTAKGIAAEYKKWQAQAAAEEMKLSEALDKIERNVMQIENIFGGACPAADNTRSLSGFVLFVSHTIEMFGSVTIEYDKAFDKYKPAKQHSNIAAIWQNMQDVRERCARNDYLLHVALSQTSFSHTKGQQLLREWGKHVHDGGAGVLARRNQQIVLDEILNSTFETLLRIQNAIVGMAMATKKIAHGGKRSPVKFWDPSVRTLFPVRTPVFCNAADVFLGVHKYKQLDNACRPKALQSINTSRLRFADLLTIQPINMSIDGPDDFSEKRVRERAMAAYASCARIIVLMHMWETVLVCGKPGVTKKEATTDLYKANADGRITPGTSISMR